MCGFVGKFGKIDNRIKSAGDKIIHRGPDMQAFNSGKDWAVQFNRLSIIKSIKSVLLVSISSISKYGFK